MEPSDEGAAAASFVAPPNEIEADGNGHLSSSAMAAANGAEGPFIVCDSCVAAHSFPMALVAGRPPLRCGRCKCVYYCSRACQKKHYREHRQDCLSLARAHEEHEAAVGTTAVGGARGAHEAHEAAVAVPPSASSGSGGGGDGGGGGGGAGGGGGGSSSSSSSSSSTDTATATADGAAAEDEDEPADECGICLQPMARPFSLPSCQHAFCVGCLQAWQASCGAVAARCPLCRSPLPGDLLQPMYYAAAVLCQRANRRARGSAARAADFGAALAKADELLELDPLHLGGHFLRSELLHFTGRHEEALAFTEAGLGIGSGVAEACLEARGRGVPVQVEEACLEAWLERKHALMARCAAELGDFERALACCRAAFGHVRRDQAVEVRAALSMSSRCYHELGDHAMAVDLGEDAIAMNRHYPGCYERVARSYAAMGRHGAAVLTLRRAVAYEEPWNPAARTALRAQLEEARAEMARAGEEGVGEEEGSDEASDELSDELSDDEQGGAAPVCRIVKKGGCALGDECPF